ncbi:hypothetical protein [Nonomuraea sp. B1E8]|uniref:hypothetical protein n=1 Tax=unclassified Nonomuraea TaxID=2593643 RepID=UPI00325F7516
MLGWTAAAVTVGVVWAALATGVTPLLVPTLCVLGAVMLTALIAWNHYDYQPWRRFVTPAGEDILEAAVRDNPRNTAEGPVAIALYGSRREELKTVLGLRPRYEYSYYNTRASGGGGCGSGGDGGGGGGGCGGGP